MMENSVIKNVEVMVENMREAHTKQWPTLNGDFFYKVNRKYIKIIHSMGNGQNSVTAFVDKENGDVYKPAGWNAPAKHVRGNVMENYGAKALDYSGYSIRYM